MGGDGDERPSELRAPTPPPHPRPSKTEIIATRESKMMDESSGLLMSLYRHLNQELKLSKKNLDCGIFENITDGTTSRQAGRNAWTKRDLIASIMHYAPSIVHYSQNSLHVTKDNRYNPESPVETLVDVRKWMLLSWVRSVVQSRDVLKNALNGSTRLERPGEDGREFIGKLWKRLDIAPFCLQCHNPK